jgi:hypothetical protein
MPDPADVAHGILKAATGEPTTKHYGWSCRDSTEMASICGRLKTLFSARPLR